MAATARSPLDHGPSCRELVELVTEYLDGALEPSVAVAVQHHLALCPPCVEYVLQMRRTAAFLGDLPEEESLPAPIERQLLAAFRGFLPPGSR
jgi:anti-sigma factor RsiW